MAQPNPIFFKITETGKDIALDAEHTGLTLRLGQFAIGTAGYNPTGGETKLQQETSRTGITSGDIDTNSHTLRFSVTLYAQVETEVWEMGLFDEQNRLFAIASSSDAPLLKIYPNIALVASFGLTLDNLNASNIQMVVDPNGIVLVQLLQRRIDELSRRPFEGIPVGGILTTAKHYENGDEVAADLRYGKWQRFAQGKVLAGFSTIGAHDGAFKTMGNEFGAINKSGGNDYHVVAFWQRMSDDWGDPRYSIRATADHSNGTITFNMTRVGGPDDVTLSQVVNGGAAQDVHVHFNGNSVQHVYRQTGYGKSTVSLAFVDYPNIAASATVEVAEPAPTINSVPLILQWRNTSAQDSSLDIYADEGAELWLVIPSNINGKVRLSNLSVNDSSGKLQSYITWYETQDSLNAKNLTAGEIKVAHYQLDESGDVQDRHDVYSDLPSYFSYSVKFDQTNTATLNITRDRPVVPSEPAPPTPPTGTLQLTAALRPREYNVPSEFALDGELDWLEAAYLEVTQNTMPSDFNWKASIAGGKMYDKKSNTSLVSDGALGSTWLNYVDVKKYDGQSLVNLDVTDGWGKVKDYTVEEVSINGERYFRVHFNVTTISNQFNQGSGYTYLAPSYWKFTFTYS